MGNITGYRGELMISFKLRDSDTNSIPRMFLKPYKVGNKIAQLIIVPYPKIEFKVVDELSTTERGTGGHGSTGA